MMTHDDTGRLQEMRQLCNLPIPRGMPLSEFAERLLKVRDALAFEDHDWYDELTGHIVTLDSAATFEAGNAAEQLQLDEAVNTAIDSMKRLIGEKLM